ncbi:MAG: serine hydrolase, partial [Chloroflexota bacterium]
MSTQKGKPTIKMSLAKSLAMMLTLTLRLSIVAPARAQENRTASGRDVPAAPSQASGPTDPAELEAFLDDFFATEMEEYPIAGAAISVVKDGKSFFAKGYGYAD